MSFAESSDLASEIDPLFHSMGPYNPTLADRHSSIGSADDLLRPIIAFPLPPRRLRPGDLVPSSPQWPLKIPSPPSPLEPKSLPVTLYGVAIGGGLITTTANRTPGRAQVKSDTYSPRSTPRQRISSTLPTNSIPDSLPPHDNQPPNLRAKNPPRYLSRPTPTCTSTPTPSPISLNLITLAQAPNLSSCSLESYSESSQLSVPQRPPRSDSLISFPSDAGFPVPPEFHRAAHNAPLNLLHHHPQLAPCTDPLTSDPNPSSSPSPHYFSKNSTPSTIAPPISVSPNHQIPTALHPPDRTGLFFPSSTARSSMSSATFVYNNKQAVFKSRRTLSDFLPSEPGKLISSDFEHQARLRAVSQALQIDDIKNERIVTIHLGSSQDTVGQEASHSPNQEAGQFAISPERSISSSAHRIRFAPPPRRSFIKPDELHLPTHRRAATEGSSFVPSKLDHPHPPSNIHLGHLPTEISGKISRPMATKKSGWKALFSSYQAKKAIISRPPISLPLPESFVVVSSKRLPSPLEQDFKTTNGPSTSLEIPSSVPRSLTFPTDDMPRRASIDNLSGKPYPVQPEQVANLNTDSIRLRPRSRSFSDLTSFPLPVQVEDLGSVPPPSCATTNHPSAPQEIPHTISPTAPSPPPPPPIITHPTSVFEAPKVSTLSANSVVVVPNNSSTTPTSKPPHLNSKTDSKLSSSSCKVIRKQVRFRRSLELIPDPSYLAYRDANKYASGQPLKPTANRPGTAYRNNTAAPWPVVPNNSAAPLPTNLSSAHTPLNPSTNVTFNPTSSHKPSSKNGVTKKAGKGMKLLARSRRLEDKGECLSPESPPGSRSSSFSPKEVTLGRQEVENQMTREQVEEAEAEADEQLDLLSRTLAPKLNLTFVDLDHHIGSRFSVHTLFKEVQKALPEVSPLELSHRRSLDELYPRSPLPDVGGYSDFQQQKSSLVQPFLDPTDEQHTRSNLQPRTHLGQASQPPQQLRPRTAPTEKQFQTFSLENNPSTQSPSQTRRLTLQDHLSQHHAGQGSQETDSRTPRNGGLDSQSDSLGKRSVELVDAQGRELMFQMVIPGAAALSPSRLELLESQLTQSARAVTSQHFWPGRNEEDIRQISERLVQLHSSLEAARLGSIERSTEVPREKKLERVETWLSSVPPSAAHTPSGRMSSDHRPVDWPIDDALASQPNSCYDENERWDEEFPESPIDRYAKPIYLARSGSKTKATLVVRNGSLKKITVQEVGNTEGLTLKKDDESSKEPPLPVVLPLKIRERGSMKIVELTGCRSSTTSIETSKPMVTVGGEKSDFNQTAGLVRMRSPLINSTASSSSLLSSSSASLLSTSSSSSSSPPRPQYKS